MSSSSGSCYFGGYLQDFVKHIKFSSLIFGVVSFFFFFFGGGGGSLCIRFGFALDYMNWVSLFLLISWYVLSFGVNSFF